MGRFDWDNRELIEFKDRWGCCPVHAGLSSLPGQTLAGHQRWLWNVHRKGDSRLGAERLPDYYSNDIK
jgi:hypothetical protein